MSEIDYGNATAEAPPIDGAVVLDDTTEWFARFLAMPDRRDYDLTTLFTVSTHLAVELYSSPRIQIDSTMPGSGKTTLLDHMARLCHHPVQAASLSSPALLVRLLQNGVRTILIDEVDRVLRPENPGVPELIAILNSGYRRGASRPVLVPVKGGSWETKEMPTFAPVVMAGNSPRLPDDTRSRSIRILLMPDLHGAVEDSDWEYIEDDAKELAERIAAFAEQVRAAVNQLEVELPAGCIGRHKEKWRPLMRVAVAAGGDWPTRCTVLIERDLAEHEAEKEAGLKSMPPGMVLLADLREVWPIGREFVPTAELVALVVAHNAEQWGQDGPYGRALTEQRFGRMVNEASKVTSVRPGGRGPRGFVRHKLEPIWHQLGMTPPNQLGALGSTGALGANSRQMHRVNRDNRVHRVDTGPSTDSADTAEDDSAEADHCRACRDQMPATLPDPMLIPEICKPCNTSWHYIKGALGKNEVANFSDFQHAGSSSDDSRARLRQVVDWAIESKHIEAVQVGKTTKYTRPEQPASIRTPGRRTGQWLASGQPVERNQTA